MKGLQQYFNEKLSDKGFEQLSQFLKSSKELSDTHVSDYINILASLSDEENIKYIKRKLKNDSINKDTWESFFDKHGLTKLNWGRKNSASKQFIKLFGDADKLDILNNIIANDGVISINSSEFKQQGNIFKDYCTGWEDEAKTIASWTQSNSANAGDCEILLKFILKEGGTGKTGDVYISLSASDDEETKGAEMEVKAHTKSDSGSHSGGHPSGQKTVNGEKARRSWAIYQWLNGKLFNKSFDNSTADNSHYFGKNINDFIKLANEQLSNDKKLFVSELVNALLYQYNFISNDKHNFENTLKCFTSNKYKSPEQVSYITNDIGKIDYNLLCKNVEEYINVNKLKNKQTILNLIGYIQLYLYSKIEEFNFLFVVYLNNKNDDDSNSGKYHFFKDCMNDETFLSNGFNSLINKLDFGPLYAGARDNTGKIYIHGIRGTKIQ